MKRTTAPWVSPLLILGLAALAPALGALELSFLPGGPVVTGVSAEGSVAWLAVSRESLHELDRVVVRRTVETIPAGSLTASLPWEGRVPFRSVFVAVELETAQEVTGTPDPGGLRFGSGGRDRGEAPGFVIPGQSLQILVVRPGGFAWHGAVADGALEDLDGAADGAVSFDLTTLTAVGDAPVSATLGAGDRIWAIDLDTLALHEITMGGGAP